MNSADASLDQRIWAYVRGELSLSERKGVESEVTSSPVAARRYATIKLTYQREMAKSGGSGEKQRPKMEAGSKVGPKEVRSPATKPPPAAITPGKAPSGDFSSLAFLAAGGILLVLSVAAYLGRSTLAEAAIPAVRDALQGCLALVVAAMALTSRPRSLAWMGTSVGCLVLACAAAALLVR